MSKAVIFIDPKGERTFHARCAAEADRHGKPFAYINPALPYYSRAFNPLGSAETPAEVVDRIKSLMPVSRDTFFVDLLTALHLHVATAQQALRIPWTLEGLYRASSIRVDLEDLIYRYLVDYLGCYRPPGKQDRLVGAIEEYLKRDIKDLTADSLIEDYRHPVDHFRKITAGNVPTFQGVTGGEIGRLLSPIGGALTWKQIVQEGMVVYIGLSSMVLGDIANRVGRLILQDLVGYLGRSYLLKDTASLPPITVFVDEFSKVAYPGFVDGVNKGGGANARFILGMQSKADPETMMGPLHTRQLLDNLNTVITFRLADQQTASEMVKDLTATVTLPERPGVGSGFGGVGGFTGHAQMRVPSTTTAAIRPSWLLALPRGEAFARIAGAIYKLRVPLLRPVPKATLDRLGLTAMWEALDPDKVYEGDLCTDLPPQPTVPPERWLPAPVPPSLASPVVNRLASGSPRKNCSRCSQAWQRVRKWCSAMGRRRHAA